MERSTNQHVGRRTAHLGRIASGSPRLPRAVDSRVGGRSSITSTFDITGESPIKDDRSPGQELGTGQKDEVGKGVDERPGREDGGRSRANRGRRWGQATLGRRSRHKCLGQKSHEDPWNQPQGHDGDPQRQGGAAGHRRPSQQQQQRSRSSDGECQASEQKTSVWRSVKARFAHLEASSPTIN